MGSFRLLLAYAVVVSHCGILVAGYNPGVVAVVPFFILSGYAMTALVLTRFADRRGTWAFYRDRFFRIYPQFAFYLVLSLAVFATGLIPFAFAPAPADWVRVLGHFAIAPLNYYMIWFMDLLYMPQAWSLGLEVTFYALLPFLAGKRWRAWLMLPSAVVFLAAYFGYLNTDAFGYRLLPGTLFMFLAGGLLWRPATQAERMAPLAVFVGALVLLAATYAWPILDKPYNRSVLLGLAIGIAGVFLLRELPRNRLDMLAGHVSYGVFLSHFILIAAIQAMTGRPVLAPVEVMLVIASSTALGLGSYLFVERPCGIWRRRAAPPAKRVAGTATASPT